MKETTADAAAIKLTNEKRTAAVKLTNERGNSSHGRSQADE
jgi:hypothetical protein